MTSDTGTKQEGVLGDSSALLVIDIQRGGATPAAESGIAIMDGFLDVVERAECVVAAAREAAVPVIFFQEVHRPDGVDFGRELDGLEGRHCVEGEPGTELWPTLVPGPGDYFVAKRRYSCFLGTDLEILLRGLRVQSLVMIGALTDVCVHYTFADAHQRDFHCRVVADCVIGSTPARHAASLDAMAYLQRQALCSTEEVVRALSARTTIGAGAAR